jgi:uncharacterized protein YprB with RNaseH-like and TPR domain
LSVLADRVRGVLQTASAADARKARPFGSLTAAPGSGDGELIPDAATDQAVNDPSALETVLGGSWRRDGGGQCFVVDSRRDSGSQHGRETVGRISDRLAACFAETHFLTGFPAHLPVLFFDLETTGLGGGAGSYPFVAGFGWFEADGSFATRQFVLTRLVDEPAMLRAVDAELSRAGLLVSFNGRSFDAPLLETRFLYHRLEWNGARLAHLDMLPIARRFWKGSVAEADSLTCSLSALEQLVGFERRGDVSGLEIPRRYFDFIRSGDARPLARVMEHNRGDLLSLAALMARALHLIRSGPAAANEREALALGWIYARAGLTERALDAYRRATGSTVSSSIQAAALKALAVAARRARSHNEAAGYWTQLLRVPGCSHVVLREAAQALAVHHEHRIRDLASARMFARRTLELGHTARAYEAGAYRLRRIERKLEKSEVLSLKFEVEV